MNLQKIASTRGEGATRWGAKADTWGKGGRWTSITEKTLRIITGASSAVKQINRVGLNLKSIRNVSTNMKQGSRNTQSTLRG